LKKKLFFGENAGDYSGAFQFVPRRYCEN
jgi:hypothetical protein